MSFYEGTEEFTDKNGKAAARLLDFWRWSGSNLLDNAYRGTLAEYLVARALGIDKSPRIEWEPFDLLYGDIKIEVKSSAYVQLWEQKENSKPYFDIHEAVTLGKRPSDIYIFCLLNEQDRSAVNPMDLKQWDFYALSTAVINEVFKHKKSVTLSRIDEQAKPVKFSMLKKEVDRIITSL